MSNTLKPKVYFIEDDYATNVYNEIVFTKMGEIETVRFFDDSIEAFHQIQSERNKPNIIFLDINMPKMNGWQIVKYIEDSPYDFLANPYHVYMLTTSLSPVDKNRSESNPYVKGFIEKPLTKEKILTILETYRQEK